jgi:hypothetical protein
VGKSALLEYVTGAAADMRVARTVLRIARHASGEHHFAIPVLDGDARHVDVRVEGEIVHDGVADPAHSPIHSGHRDRRPAPGRLIRPGPDFPLYCQPVMSRSSITS